MVEQPEARFMWKCGQVQRLSGRWPLGRRARVAGPGAQEGSVVVMVEAAERRVDVVYVV